jgi:hypothetical protein
VRCGASPSLQPQGEYINLRPSLVALFMSKH